MLFVVDCACLLMLFVVVVRCELLFEVRCCLLFAVWFAVVAFVVCC